MDFGFVGKRDGQFLQVKYFQGWDIVVEEIQDAEPIFQIFHAIKLQSMTTVNFVLQGVLFSSAI